MTSQPMMDLVCLVSRAAVLFVDVLIPMHSTTMQMQPRMTVHASHQAVLATLTARATSCT